MTFSRICGNCTLPHVSSSEICLRFVPRLQARRDRLTAVAVCKKSVWEMLNDAYHLARVATKSSEETSGINTMDCLQLSAIPSGLLMCDDSG